MENHRKLANIKSQLSKIQSKNPENILKIVVIDPENPDSKREFTPESLPDLNVIEEIFPFSSVIEIDIYSNKVKIKKYSIELTEDIEQEPQELPAQNQNKIDSQFVESLIKTQEALFSERLKAITEINDLKLQALKDQFSESLEHQRQMFKERQELERLTIEKELERDEEVSFQSTIKETIQEIIPVIKDIAQNYFEAKMKTVKINEPRI